MTRRAFFRTLFLSVFGMIAPTGRATDGATLTAAEAENLLAFGEVLVEGRALSSAERRYLAEHIEYVTKRASADLDSYRTAANLLDRLAGRRFSSLAITKRTELIERHRLDARVTTRVAPDAVPYASEIRIVRTRVVPGLIGGYWASPAGWAAVGYASFPGRCGDLTRYTRPEP